MIIVTINNGTAISIPTQTVSVVNVSAINQGVSVRQSPSVFISASSVGVAGPQGAAGADGVGVPAGGTEFQVLRKASGTDYDTEWDYADRITLEVRFDEAVTKGDPLYVTGFNSGQNRITVAKADASDSSKMPSIGLAFADYSLNDNGQAMTIGNLDDVNTQVAPNDFQEGDVLYVKAGGGLTNIKPTGTNLIQNVGKVSRRQQINGEIVVMAIGRTNDIPNLTSGKFFIGSATNTTESAYTLPTSDGSAGQVLQTDGAGAVTFEDASSSGSVVIASTSTQARLNTNDAFFFGNDTYGWNYIVWTAQPTSLTSTVDDDHINGIICPVDATNINLFGSITRINGNGTDCEVRLYKAPRPNGSTSNIALTLLGSMTTGAFTSGVSYNTDISATSVSISAGDLIFVMVRKTGGTNTTTYSEFNFTLMVS